MTLRVRFQPSIFWKTTTTTTYTQAYPVPVPSRYGQHPASKSKTRPPEHHLRGSFSASGVIQRRRFSNSEPHHSSEIIQRFLLFPSSPSGPRHKEPHPSSGHCAAPAWILASRTPHAPKKPMDTQFMAYMVNL